LVLFSVAFIFLTVLFPVRTVTAKPSDLLAELQGRLPIRVTLKGLTEEDMYRILTEPVTNLIKQQMELMRSENVDLVFTDEAIREVARVAFLVRLTATLSLCTGWF
jgi:ATP-dependent HslUV protease ATP-binding subunit HslU